MTHSVRIGDWELYVSAMRRAMALFFVFGRTNYSRWGPLHLQDCLDLQRKFPQIYKVFKDKGFVMYHTNRQGSAVGFDMALEKVYNKPAKRTGGIIGMTRRKEAVGMWNLLKHEKDQYVANMTVLCSFSDEDDELNLHHDFRPLTSKQGYERVNDLYRYIASIGNPFRSSRMHNIVTGVEIPEEIVKNLLNAVQFGDRSYNQYVQLRLSEKQKSIHDLISANRNYLKVSQPPSKQSDKRPMGNSTASDVLQYLDYAKERGYDTKTLLSYELSANALYLEAGKQIILKPNNHR